MIRRFFAKSFLVLTAAAIAIGPARCNPLSHALHYVRTHKELLAYDAIVTAGEMADAASTVHCMHYSFQCTEDNSELPLRPTNLQLYRYGGALSLGAIAAGHLWWHFAPQPADRHAIWWLAIPVAAGDAMATKDNVDSLDLLQPKGK